MPWPGTWCRARSPACTCAGTRGSPRGRAAPASTRRAGTARAASAASPRGRAARSRSCTRPPRSRSGSRAPTAAGRAAGSPTGRSCRRPRACACGQAERAPGSRPAPGARSSAMKVRQRGASIAPGLDQRRAERGVVAPHHVDRAGRGVRAPARRARTCGPRPRARARARAAPSAARSRAVRGRASCASTLPRDHPGLAVEAPLDAVLLDRVAAVRQQHLPAARVRLDPALGRRRGPSPAAGRSPTASSSSRRCRSRGRSPRARRSPCPAARSRRARPTPSSSASHGPRVAAQACMPPAASGGTGRRADRAAPCGRRRSSGAPR